MCREVNSGPDRQRTSASEIKLDTVVDDSVSASKKDATDWKFVVLEQPGQLTAELHWDSGDATLGLELYDDIGSRIAEGKNWKQKGKRVQFKATKKGRYFIRIFVDGDGGSTYSLRMRHSPVKEAALAKGTCHNCTVGERICLRGDGYAICKQTPNWCNAWSSIKACPKGKTCQKGACVDGCTNECKEEERRCSSKKGYQVCRKSATGCLQWGDVTDCGKRHRCRGGKCLKYRPGKVHKPDRPFKPTKPTKPVATSSRGLGKIISIYRFRGRMTLHIEVGDDSGVRPGMTGTVLAGGSNSPLSDGAIKVTKVSGRYCIATTNLKKLGKNRRVRINLP